MYRCVVMKPDRIDDGLRAAWLDLARASGQTIPLLHPDFAALMGRVRNDVRIVGVYRGDELCAILPVHVRPGGFARPLGAPFADLQGLIAAPDFDRPLGWILAKAGLRTLVLDSFAGPQACAAGLAPGEPVHAILVDGDLEAVLETQRALHAKRFKNHRRLARQLERDHGPVELVAPDPDTGAYHQLIAWKRDQFVRTGRHDVLSPDWARQMMDVLHEGGNGEAEGLLITLRAGGRMAAGLYGLRTGDRYNPWIAAFDADFAPYSPGQILLRRAMEAMPALGLTRIDLAGGHDHYKKYYANHAEPVRAGTVTGNGLSGALTGLAGLPWALGEHLPGRLAEQARRAHRRADLIASVELDWRGRLEGAWRALKARGTAGQETT